jgi:adenine-specific DNA-methyltransferase
MKKITATDPESQSPDLIVENMTKLRELFPELVTEGPSGPFVNVDVLKQLVGDQTLTDAQEKYGLNWHGKRQARQLALTPSTGTLRPCPEDSVDWDTTQNLMIEGDNLEVLKLLQKSYAGKVKLIYIDPPYNTGKDFVYPDNFQDNIKNYLEITGQVGEGGQKLSSNSETSGRFHTDWLNMMYPRLKLAHALLKQDGAIFVSCDEGEQSRVRLIMDEIFGQENFVADIVWAAGRKNDSRLISVSHEYIVCYSRNLSHLKENKIEWRQRKKGLEDIYAHHAKLKRIHGDNYAATHAEMKLWYKNLPSSHPAKAHAHYNCVDERGVFFAADISSISGASRPRYEILHPITGKAVAVPARGWGFTLETLRRLVAEGRVHFGPDHTTVPTLKAYLAENEYQPPYSVFYQDGRAASKRLRSLMGDDCFNFPKDETVLQELIGMMTSGNDLVVDCFAGSGTTGHAVMLQNAADGGKRRYLLVQLPEKLDTDNASQKAAAQYCDKLRKPKTLAELTKSRLRKAAEQISTGDPNRAVDLGFRAFKLDSTNIREWDPSWKNIAESLEKSVEHLKENRTERDILCELLLKLGLDLCVPIEEKKIAGHDVQSVGSGTLIVCLSEKVAKEDVEALAKGIIQWHKELKPAGETTIVFRDAAFPDDVAKANLTAILAQSGLETVRSL